MALYILRSIYHLARILYVRPKTFGPHHVTYSNNNNNNNIIIIIIIYLLSQQPQGQLKTQNVTKKKYKNTQITGKKHIEKSKKKEKASKK